MKKIFLMFLTVLFVSFVFAQNQTVVKPTNNAKARVEVKTSDLKKEITDNIAKDYAGYTIEKSFKIEKEKVITYNIVIAKGDVKSLLVYDKDGKFLKKSEKNKGNGDKGQFKMVFTCSMHPEVQMDKPGKCPKCSMDLIRKKIPLTKNDDVKKENIKK